MTEKDKEKEKEFEVEGGETAPKFSDYWKNDDGTPRETTYTPNQYDPTKSTAVTGALDALNTALSQKPVYTSAWENQISDILGQIQNRNKFSYDVNGDALYQQYKDKYIQQGKLAMQDTIGQAAAMTGGFGNSYAATVGNQAYQAQLNNLNDVVPELYQMAYDRYNQEGQDLYNKYALYADRENADYAKHRDEVTDWQNNVDYLAGRYDSERSLDYANWSDYEAAKQEQWNADYSNAWDKYTADYNEYVDSVSGLTDLGYSVSDAEKIADKMDMYKEEHNPSGAWNFLAMLDSGNAALNAYTFEQYFGYNFAQVKQDTTVPRASNSKLDLMEKRMGH